MHGAALAGFDRPLDGVRLQDWLEVRRWTRARGRYRTRACALIGACQITGAPANSVLEDCPKRRVRQLRATCPADG